MSANDAADERLTLRRVESVPAGSRVRHVDELTEGELTRFTELLELDLSAVIEDGEFTRDDVIVFTEYYHVTRG